MVGEDIFNCLNKIIEEDKYLQYISLGLPAIIPNNQVIESILNVLLMDIIKCIIKMSVFLLFQKIQGMILDN